MVSLSKLLDKGFRDAKCQEVIHPGLTCLQFHTQNIRPCLTTNMKYFLPLLAIHLIMKGRKLKKAHIWDAFKYYLEAISTGFLISYTTLLGLCGTRAVLGRFGKYSFLYIPGMFSTLPLLFTSKRIARLFGTTVLQVNLEIILRSGRNPITRTISQSKLIQTLMFMTCSVFVLHTVQKYGLKMFWVIKAIPCPKEGENNKCDHNGSCYKFCFNEMAKTLLIGIPFDLYKTFSRGNSKVRTLKTNILTMDFSTTLFLSSYTIIYRLTSCLLARTWKSSPQIKHIIAAFLGGSSFYFLPKLAMVCFGITSCVQISWELFKRYKFEDDKISKFVEKLKKIPFDRFYAILRTGLILHVYVVRPQLLNSMGKGMVMAFSGNRSSSLRTNAYKYFKTIDK